MNPSATAFRIVTGIIGIIGLVLSFLYGPMSDLPSLPHRVLRFFTLFTMLTNLLATLAMLVPTLRPGTRLAARLSNPCVRISLTSFILIVGLVYHYLLFDDLRRWHGAGYVSSIITHYVMPSLMFADWLLFVPKGGCAWNTSFRSLLYPCGYLGWVLAQGAFTGWYPYPFLDVSQNGMGKVLLNATTLAAAFFLTAAVLLLIDRLMTKSKP